MDLSTIKLTLFAYAALSFAACAANDAKDQVAKTASREGASEVLVEPSASQKVSILNHSGIAHLKNTLLAIIHERAPGSTQTQHFFIADYDNDSSITYMLWKEQQKLWILSLGGDSEESWLGARYPSSGKLIDLNKDVVKTPQDVGTSTYLVDKQWALEKVYDTVINGSLVTIEPTKNE